MDAATGVLLVVAFVLAAGSLGIRVGVWVYHPAGERYFRKASVWCLIGAAVVLVASGVTYLAAM